MYMSCPFSRQIEPRLCNLHTGAVGLTPHHSSGVQVLLSNGDADWTDTSCFHFAKLKLEIRCKWLILMSMPSNPDLWWWQKTDLEVQSSFVDRPTERAWTSCWPVAPVKD